MSAGTRNPASTGDRGQLVLVAALALALVLVSLGIAYLQLGYHDDIDAGSDDPAHQLEGTLEEVVHDAAVDIPGTYSWSERDDAATSIRAEVDPVRKTLETMRLSDGHAYTVDINQTRASQWATQNCPHGPDREFGDCIAIDGVILQERNDRTHVLGAAFDLEITTPAGETVALSLIEIQAA